MKSPMSGSLRREGTLTSISLTLLIPTDITSFVHRSERVRVCASVGVRERESVCVSDRVGMCVCVCVTEREQVIKIERERK